MDVQINRSQLDDADETPSSEPETRKQAMGQNNIWSNNTSLDEDRATLITLLEWLTSDCPKEQLSKYVTLLLTRQTTGLRSR